MRTGAGLQDHDHRSVEGCRVPGKIQGTCIRRYLLRPCWWRGVGTDSRFVASTKKRSACWVQGFRRRAACLPFRSLVLPLRLLIVFTIGSLPCSDVTEYATPASPSSGSEGFSVKKNEDFFGAVSGVLASSCLLYEPASESRLTRLSQNVSGVYLDVLRTRSGGVNETVVDTAARLN